MPNLTQQTIAIFNRVADGYEKEALRLFPFTADRLLRHLRPVHGERIVDVACGTGAVTVAVAQEVGQEAIGGGRVHGVDLAEGMLDRCAAHAKRLGLTNIDLHEMDGAKLEFRRGYFDAAVCSFGLHFMSEPAVAVKSWARAVRPGGRVLFTAFGPEAFQPQMDLLIKQVVSHGGRPPEGVGLENYRHLAEPENCRALLEAAGLERVEVTTEPLGYHLATPEDWWELVSNSGSAALLATLPEDRLGDLKREHLASIQELLTEDGLWLELPVHMALGYKP